MTTPSWFGNWYPIALRQVQEKLFDQEESRAWLEDAMRTAASLPEAQFKTSIEESIQQLSGTEQPPLPNRWDQLSDTDRLEIIRAFNGQQPLSESAAGSQFEQLLAPLISEEPLSSPYDFWLWQVLLEQADVAAENQIRHWVDADRKNLEAFEARYELAESIKTIPGTIRPDPDQVWALVGAPEESTGRHRSGRIKKSGFALIVFLLLTGTTLGIRWYLYTEGTTSILQAGHSYKSIGLTSEMEVKGDTLIVDGRGELHVASTDRFVVSGATLKAEPGAYRIKSVRDDWQFRVNRGQLTLTTPFESFLILEGQVLSKKQGIWYKEEK